MVQQSKPPNKARRVFLNDFTVVQDGSTYYPHAGEWVDFRGRPSLGFYMKLMQLGESPEGVEMLHGFIAGWSLTDDDGKPLPNPPSIGDLLMLPRDEFTWILSHVETEASPNGVTPSTVP